MGKGAETGSIWTASTAKQSRLYQPTWANIAQTAWCRGVIYSPGDGCAEQRLVKKLLRFDGRAHAMCALRTFPRASITCLMNRGVAQAARAKQNHLATGIGTIGHGIVRRITPTVAHLRLPPAEWPGPILSRSSLGPG